VAIALAALFLAACGGDDDDDGGGGATATEAADGGDDDDGGDAATPTPDNRPTPEVPDVCALLTTDEVSEALGAAVGEGEQTNTNPFFICNWLETDGFASVTLEVLTGSSDSREFYFTLTTDAEELEGLGNAAHYDAALVGVEVLTEDYLLGLSISSSDLGDDERRESSIELAETALGRLED
jgi:hypothetical protein